MSRIALKYWIAIVITALQTLLIGVVLWLTLSMRLGSIDMQMASKAQALGATTGEVARIALIRGEYDDLQPYVVKLTADPEIHLVRIADRTGRVVVSTDPSEVGLSAPPPPREGRTARLWLVDDIVNPSGKLGTLYVHLSDAMERRDYERARDVALFIAILGVMLSALVGVVFGHLLTRRLKVLADATQQIAAGYFDLALPVVGTDEVAKLSGLFNRMAESLRTHIATLKRSEERLRQAHKLEAVGRLAGGVAHDFNNILTLIRGHCDLVLPEVEHLPEVHEDVKVIIRATESAAALTRQLLAFSRKQVLQPRVINVNDLVAKTEAMLRRVIGEDVKLVSRLESSPWLVSADPGQVEQVILNLVVNAREAMPQGGTLTLETSNVVLDESYTQRHPGVRPGDCVMLAVSDTGQGMDAETMSRIFEPFFTTKKEGHGTGLGLATVHGIVQQSGGHLSVYSEPGHGTTLKVYLPRVEGTAVEEVPRPLFLTPLPSRGTALVAEDADGVRRLVKQVLHKRGFLVLEARSGEEALAVAAAHPGPIDLLVTDVVMPGMNGREMADRLAKERPGTKVLYMSGYTEDAIIAQGVLKGSIDFIEKPFSTFAFERKVAETLGRSERPSGSQDSTEGAAGT